MCEPTRSECFSINVAGELVSVDLDRCSSSSEVLAQLQGHSKRTLEASGAFNEFPGGAQLFRNVLAFFVAANGDIDDRRRLNVTLSDLPSPLFRRDSMSEYLRAAVLLRSSLLVLGIARSTVCEELTSDLALLLLEQTISFTSDPHALLPIEELSEPMEKALVEIVCSLCTRIEECDFQLGSKVASPSLRISLEILKCHRAKLEHKRHEVFGAALAESQEATLVGWSEHEFAVHVLRGCLQKSFAAAHKQGTIRTPPQLPSTSLLGAASDREDALESKDPTTSCDITEEMCDSIPDAELICVAEFLEYLEYLAAPPMLSAVIVRALLASHLQDDAREFFRANFAANRKIQEMVVTGQIPARFLRDVSKHRDAAVVLRSMLATYETINLVDLCDLCDDVLFSEFLEEEHASHVIFRHALMRPLLLWMRSGGVAGGAASGAQAFDLSPISGEGDSSISRLRSVGARLFALCFISHEGFLPTEAFPDSPWDSGGFDMALLEQLPLGEDALQLARRVLLRYLWRGVGKQTLQSISKLWELGRWSRCLDEHLISEAFAFLSACWRALAGLSERAHCSDEQTGEESSVTIFPYSGDALVGSGDRRTSEETLFKMFADLDVWRLPPKDLLTPWVPGQILVCHVTAQCRQLEECQVTLAEEAHSNLQEIAELRATIAQLTARLESTDARSQACMRKQADLNETLRQLQ